jgi:hypothetical protein
MSALMLFAEPGATSGSKRLPEETSNEPGPSWDPRPAWQRAKSGGWRQFFERRPVEQEMPVQIVPVAESRPFRVPRAMSAKPVEMAPAVQPLTDTTPGKITASPCKKALNYLAPKSTAADDKQFIGTLEKVIGVLRANPMFPPPGFEIAMDCSFERRSDGTGIYQGKITLLFYPYSDKNHYWHGGLEILVNDLGVMGPRANAGDRATDATVVFSMPAPATYLGHPFLQSQHGVWGGLYLTRRPEDIHRFVTYREWLNENLPRLQSEYAETRAAAEAKPTVRNQVTRRNFQSMYERALITKEQTPPAELDTPVWIADLAPSDAAHLDAARQARLNVPGYFNRSLPAHTIQLINILPMHSKYNHLHSVLGKLDYAALMKLIE